MLDDDGIPALPERVHHLAHFLNVRRFGDGLKARDLGNEDGGLLALLGGRRRR
jgi:hypothetical protein